jgi:hypothetical protein
MNIVKASAGYMESILNEGLCVLIEAFEIQEGELFAIQEVNAGEPTGRTFFARAMHTPHPGTVQFNLQPFMDALNVETGRVERLPMTGAFANEKASMPEGDPATWSLPVAGEKPVWIYSGMKWLMELSLAKFFFEKGKGLAPTSLHLRAQMSGGEKVFCYRLVEEVKFPLAEPAPGAV